MSNIIKHISEKLGLVLINPVTEEWAFDCEEDINLTIDDSDDEKYHYVWWNNEDSISEAENITGKKYNRVVFSEDGELGSRYDVYNSNGELDSSGVY